MNTNTPSKSSADNNSALNVSAPQKVIGIFGGSASGKTTLARKVLELGGPAKVTFIALDSYYQDQSQKSMEQRLLTNYDHPEAFEIELLIQHLLQLKQGKTVNIPRYDFKEHTRQKDTLQAKPTPLIVVEGILVGHFQALLDQLDLKIFCDVPADLRFRRRYQRDVVERGRTEESVTRQWQESVQPMFLEFCQPSMARADWIMTEHDNVEDYARKILAACE